MNLSSRLVCVHGVVNDTRVYLQLQAAGCTKPRRSPARGGKAKGHGARAYLPRAGAGALRTATPGVRSAVCRAVRVAGVYGVLTQTALQRSRGEHRNKVQ